MQGRDWGYEVGNLKADESQRAHVREHLGESLLEESPRPQDLNVKKRFLNAGRSVL